jgi:hypothetical protein
MKMKTRVARGLSMTSRNAIRIDGCNHKTGLANGVRVHTAVKAGRITANHNETLVSALSTTTLKTGHHRFGITQSAAPGPMK